MNEGGFKIMKKFALFMTGAMLAMSMAACSPTQKETAPAGAAEASTGGAAPAPWPAFPSPSGSSGLCRRFSPSSSWAL